jgi:hypothetical protein
VYDAFGRINLLNGLRTACLEEIPSGQGRFLKTNCLERVDGLARRH